MNFYITKVVITTLLIVLISEISKRNSIIGAVLASIPLVSVLAMIWMYVDTNTTDKIVELSERIIWLVLPSWALFITLPLLIKKGYSFYVSLGIGLTLTMIGYFIVLYFLDKSNS